MDSSKLDRILPFKSTALWKGVGLGALISLLLLAVVIPNLFRYRMAGHSPAYYQLASLSGGGGGREEVSGDETYVQADGPKVIYKAQVELLVANCAETLTKIRSLTAAEAGFVQSSTVEENSARMTLRVPSAHFEDIRGKLRDLAIRVTHDTEVAADVTKQYVDRDARLRNLRAEEQQFLEIMKKAHSVPEVLAVTKELSRVRGEIDLAETELRQLKDQIDMSEIAVSLTSQVSTAAHWAPGTSTRSAFQDMLQSLASFGDFVIWLIVYLPVLALWAVTIVLLAAVCWYVLRKAAGLFRFLFRKKGVVSGSSA